MHLVKKTTSVVIWYNLLIHASQVLQEDFKSCPLRSVQLITTAGNERRVLSSESFLEAQLFLIPFHRKEYQFLVFTLHGLFRLFTWEPSAQATNHFYTLEAKMPTLKPYWLLLTLFSKSWYVISLRKRVHNMQSSGLDSMQDLWVVQINASPRIQQSTVHLQSLKICPMLLAMKSLWSKREQGETFKRQDCLS